MVYVILMTSIPNVDDLRKEIEQKESKDIITTIINRIRDNSTHKNAIYIFDDIKKKTKVLADRISDEFIKKGYITEVYTINRDDNICNHGNSSHGDKCKWVLYVKIP